MNTNYKTIDEYIEKCPMETQEVLNKLRQTIKESCPHAVEKISWSMPSFWQNGYVVQFMLHTKHIGLYPGPEIIEVFKDKLKEYKTTKGTIQLPMSKPIPYDLIKEIVKYKVEKILKERRK